VQEKGLAIVPTQLYLKDGRAKIEIALGRGKKLHDKRQTIAKRDSKRQVERALKERYQ
jgi:SsrA-binding protein